MNEQTFPDVDVAAIESFESDWLAGHAGPLEEYMPPHHDPRFPGTIEELVHVDLEFRWKGHQKNPGVGSLPDRIEQYLERFPELQSALPGLIKGEFELVNRFGEGVSIQQYIDRFGKNVGGVDLASILSEVESNLKKRSVVKPGVQIDRYRIENEHGRGGFGAVWRANDTKLGRRIAVKQLGQSLARDAESRRRFMSEARVTAKLEHPGIVPVYDISSPGDEHAYYTMRLIQGQTLAEAIEALHRSTPGSNAFELQRSRLLQAFVNTCQTIQYAHNHGVTHRDIKPQNIIVGDYGETIILDWGLASVVDTDVDPVESLAWDQDPEILTEEESLNSLRGAVMGTPAYMAPEQAMGKLDQINRQSDVYSLGATLYHLITGKVPFADGPLDQLLNRVKTANIEPAHVCNAVVEPALSAIAARAMKLKPQQRYDDAAALLDDVQRFLADQPVSAHRDRPLQRAARWIRKNPTTAATLAITTLFLLIASTAGLMVKNAWDAREEKRVNDLRVAAERADATAYSQIRSSRFKSAVETLDEALGYLQGEELLTGLAEKIEQRQTRTRAIVDFYDYGKQAQEETFFDRVSTSAIFCQAALDELGVLSHPDWWSELPVADLSEQQAEQIRTEVYRILGLLASMRLAQTAEQAFSFDMITNPSQENAETANSERANFIQAAGFAAAQGNRFRPGRGLQVIEQVASVASGKQGSVDFFNLQPLNSIDGAMMGSILDNNVPGEGMGRTAISALLNFRDPNTVANEWLDAAMRDNPDWYWLPVFMGSNLTKSGNPQEGIKAFSHALAARPDYWVAYQYRAWASLIAAQAPELDAQEKSRLLGAATRDLQRAQDLERHNPELYWLQAIIHRMNNMPLEQVNRSFLKALSVYPKLADIREGHYSTISKHFYDEVGLFVEQQRSSEERSQEFFELDAALHLWKGEHEMALVACRDGLSQFPESDGLALMQQLIRIERNPASPDLTLIQVPKNYFFTWQASCANADLLETIGDNDEEVIHREQAIESALSEWQVSTAYLKLAKTFARASDAEPAIRMLQQALEIDYAADIDDLKGIADAQELSELSALCDDVMLKRTPRTRFLDGSTIVQRPALLNGGFELGLSFYWTPFFTTNAQVAWNNSGQSFSATETTDVNPNSGLRSLRIDINSPVEIESYGQMTQVMPVSRGREYKIRFFARADEVIDNGLEVGTLSESGEFSGSLSINSGTYDWRRFEFTVVPVSNRLQLTIRARGGGFVCLDDFEITEVDSLGATAGDPATD